MENNFLTADELQVLCKEWQDRLRLNEWDIVVNIYRAREFYNEGCIGENTWELRKAESIIRILDPVDYPENTRFPLDMEQVLVHELLHLLFAPFEPNDKTLQHDFMEQTIDRLAKVLVDMKRGQQHGLCAGTGKRK